MSSSHILLMGQVHASAQPCVISTVLGSCVAVCLWDAGAAVGGMNHFMLPHWNGQGLPRPRFGNIAVPALVDAVLALGARRGALVAKVFGGGHVFARGEMPAMLNVGHRNAEYALAALEREGIAVVAQRLKPAHGIKVAFDTGSGEVLLRRLSRLSPSSPRSPRSPQSRPDAVNFDARASIPHEPASSRCASSVRCPALDSA